MQTQSKSRTTEVTYHLYAHGENKIVISHREEKSKSMQVTTELGLLLIHLEEGSGEI
jgi:hypothetical protein